MSLNITKKQNKSCNHESGAPYFVEQDGNKIMYQCQSCGKVWWEKLSNKNKSKYLPNSLPKGRK